MTSIKCSIQIFVAFPFASSTICTFFCMLEMYEKHSEGVISDHARRRTVFRDLISCGYSLSTCNSETFPACFKYLIAYLHLEKAPQLLDHIQIGRLCRMICTADVVGGEEGFGLQATVTGGSILHQYGVSEWVGLLGKHDLFNCSVEIWVEREGAWGGGKKIMDRDEKREGG